MIENLKNFDTVKERIYVRLINRKRNEEQLKHLAFIPVLDSGSCILYFSR